MLPAPASFPNFVEERLAPIMAEAGYSRDRAVWRKPHDETILVVALRRSRDGRDCGILLGSYIRQLGGKPRPSIHDCQLSFSFEKAVPDAWRPKRLQYAAHIGDNAGNPSRLEQKMEGKWELIRTALLGHALPYLEKLSTVNECRAEAAQERVVKFFNPAVRQQVVGLNPTAGTGGA